jgi:preprotein translocase subunit SecA
LLGLLKKLFGTSTERDIKKLTPLLEQVNAHERRISAMSNDTLRGQTGLFKEKLLQGATLDDLLPEAFAVAREAAKRVVGMRPFDAQIMGGIVLHGGGIAEMVTGEGKTLVAVMPSYLNGLTGDGVHMVTVNDYLARRDAEWMGPIHRFLGLNVGIIQHDMSEWERQAGYRADITYGTNNEYGFDYLRDNGSPSLKHCVQRKLNYAIVDEVDSILIDEARTPLIISGRPEKSSDMYLRVDDVVRQLRKDIHFEKDEKQRHIILTDDGMVMCERLLGVDDMYTDDSIGYVHMIEQSLKAHHFFKRDDEYMVKDDEVLIVDEFTGRVMEGRRYSDGLHQAIEAKERVPLRFESQTIATITYQNYFRMYNKLAGMTGTALTEAVEFENTYNLTVTQIPTNLPLIRQDQTDLVFASEMGKFNYVIRDIAKITASGRPILVGTVSIEKSEQVAQMLDQAGITGYQVLNAKHHEREAAIVSNAGKRSAITIATNMAGRGTDIKLAEGVRELGGLYIIGTERHESRRIDNQLRGRCGRQGDPGTTRFYVSLEDEVARLFGGNRVKSFMGQRGGEEMDETPLNMRILSRSIESAQRKVEEFNFESRKHLLDYDQVMDKQRKYIYGLRREILEGRNLTDHLHRMIQNIIGDMMDTYAPEDKSPDNYDYEGLEAAFFAMFGFEFDLDDSTDEAEPLPDSLFRQATEEYQRREALFVEKLQIHFDESEDEIYRTISPEKYARKRFQQIEASELLRVIDEKWINHLYEMDYLRESVRLRAFGQKDPLLEYKEEGYELFNNLIQVIEDSAIQMLYRITDPERRHGMAPDTGRAPEGQAKTQRTREYQYSGATKEGGGGFAHLNTDQLNVAAQKKSSRSEKQQPVRVVEKIMPNDPCPCGSGKKYKKCCGRINN